VADNLHENFETAEASLPDNENLSDISSNLEKMSRAELLEITGRLIKHLDKKSIAGRLSDIDTEKMRDSKTRLLIESVKVHGLLLKDMREEQYEERLKALEEKLL